MASGCYVYAIQRRGTQLPPVVLGLDDRPLTAVPLRDLEAVVSAMDRERAEPRAENVLRHETVVEAVRRMGPSIPVRFGTVLRNPAAVVDALSSRYAVLRDDVDRLGDKIEMSLSVLWEPPPTPEAPDQKSASRESPGARYLQARWSEHRREAQLRDRAGQLAHTINAELTPHALDHRLQTLPTDRLALRVAYLVHQSQVRNFQDAFAELRRKRTHLRFLLSGPWPPYSFVTAEEGPRRSQDTLLPG